MKDHSELSIMILKVLLKNFFLDAIPIQFLTKTYTDRQLKYTKKFMVCQQEKLRICLILRSNITIHIPSVNTELKGKNSSRYFGAFIWNAIPLSIKTASFFNAFKKRTIFWKPNCPLRLCNTFLV